MTHSPGAEMQGMPGRWTGVPRIDQIATEVFLGGGLIQLLTECDATSQLLTDSALSESDQLRTLFSVVQPNHPGYDERRAITWLAFSYMCAYVDELSKTQQGTEEDNTYFARKNALKAVVAGRNDLLKRLIENPDVLFVGADKPMSELCKLPVVQGVGTPTVNSVLANHAKLTSAANESKWQRITDAEWLKLCGANYRIMRIDVSGFHFQVDNLQIVTIEATMIKGVSLSAAECVVRLADRSLRHQTEGHFVGQVLSLRYGLDGNLCEDDTANMATQTAGDAHWQDKAADWRLGLGGNRMTYYTEVHPKITQYLCSVVPFTSTPKKITVLDIAGGNGDLAERVIKELAAMFPAMSLNYVLVDYSPTDIKVATRRFGQLSVPPTFNLTAKALLRDMLSYNYDATKAAADLGVSQGADVIINSGGLLNNQIGNTKDTPEKFNLMFAHLLKQGGFGVYGGLTPLLVNAATHRKHGLTVINLYDPERQRQLHVVRK
ncbi:class I SAM-dependent methyltransferase [Lentzea sp. NPDC092896]|uniref:class I SAM-dependent methyltransferase n=1 Tax=Lentzea sp. NPDC092896 TaxID=3364127 RepID=UPI003802CF71